MSNNKRVEVVSRVDFYTLIHKAQRAHLFALSTKIGRADLSDEEELKSIEQELREIIAHLNEHSHNETTFIHPLYNEIGNQVAGIDDEHDDLEVELHKLEAILSVKGWGGLYSAFNRFIALYLMHQDEEETMQEEILWKYFDDGRLDAALTAFKMSRPLAQTMEGLKFMVPHLSNSELAGILQSIKDSAPTPAFLAVSQIFQQHLEPSRWTKLSNSLKN